MFDIQNNQHVYILCFDVLLLNPNRFNNKSNIGYLHYTPIQGCKKIFANVIRLFSSTVKHFSIKSRQSKLI